MSRLERAIAGLRSRPETALFLLLSAVPALVAVFSFRQPIPIPDAVLPVLEVLFRLFVYEPVAAIRAVLFDPFGLDVLFAVPGLEQVAVVATLLGFYYCVSVALVRASRLLRRGSGTDR